MSDPFIDAEEPMELLKCIILGVIQGLTEFLPISSSGHLVVLQHVLHFKGDKLSFDILLHLGTLVAVVLFFAKDIRNIAFRALSEIKDRRYGPNLRFAILVVLANIPAGVVGVFFKKQIKTLFEAPTFACAMFLVTAVLLITTRFTQEKGRYALLDIPYLRALLIGCAQALAILPGISRSGATIAIAMALFVKKEDAARFSFLMSIPAVAGAFVLDLKDIQQVRALIHINAIAGFAVALITGYLSLKLLTFIIKKGRLYFFAFYLLPVGAASLIYFFVFAS
jgi:undecaprenyl-diphosphatase